MKKQFQIAAILFFCFVQNSINSSAQSEADPKIKFFIEGAKTVKTFVEGTWPHKWSVIEYSDGYCIFNRFKAKRTMADVVNHSMGKGDCDWWPWPEGSKHVCLDSEKHALQLVKAHGKIKNIRWIDHPTRNCGN